MYSLILNNERLDITHPPGTPLIEIIRNHQRLKGTKLACGEGECGACTVLVGRLTHDGLRYHSVTSCITPVINVAGTHVVTIEGLPHRSPVHHAMVACGGTQCGFCTPGFVMSMAGALLSAHRVTAGHIISSMDGNICRCTGYKSIDRAAEMLATGLGDHSPDIDSLVNAGVLYPYFREIGSRLLKIQHVYNPREAGQATITGGGTDLYIQRPLEMRASGILPIYRSSLGGITVNGDICTIGAGTTMAELQSSSLLGDMIPQIAGYLAPVGSTQIRNMATLGGNLVNASPIADLAILFLALGADIIVRDEGITHTMPLCEFYLAYKTLNKSPEAIVTALQFPVLSKITGFHFERVCKRTYLDVASVNSGCMLQCDAEYRVTSMHLSAGGVAPVPLYLTRTTAFMLGRQINGECIREAAKLVQEEISPISDIRGSAEYKRLLMRQLFFIHMQRLSPVPIALDQLLRA